MSSVLRLRALADPIRWKLMDLLESEGSATATSCAVGVAESVASCSYHLGILAKYGFIELVPGRTGREKPWRILSSPQYSPRVLRTPKRSLQHRRLAKRSSTTNWSA